VTKSKSLKMIFNCPTHGFEYESPCELAHEFENRDSWGLYFDDFSFKRRLNDFELQFALFLFSLK